jgi:hypothetical protein
MAATLPYLPTYKNVGKLFEKIASAKTPDAFTHAFLQNTLGLKGTGDRALIPLLRALGFIDATNKPLTAYGALKNTATAKAAIAEAVRSAYKPLFDSNEKANALSQDELKGLVAQVAGSDSDMTTKIVGTLNALIKVADFDAKKQDSPKDGKDTKDGKKDAGKQGVEASAHLTGLRPDFHFNIQVHLPANATEEAYLSIFTALRKAFQ